MWVIGVFGRKVVNELVCYWLYCIVVVYILDSLLHGGKQSSMVAGMTASMILGVSVAIMLSLSLLCLVLVALGVSSGSRRIDVAVVEASLVVVCIATSGQVRC